MENGSLPKVVAGDGDSPQTPVEFTPCDRTTRVAAEYRYICSRFGVEGIDWNRGMHLTRMGPISEWVIELDDGTSRSVFFDASVSLDVE